MEESFYHKNIKKKWKIKKIKKNGGKIEQRKRRKNSHEKKKKKKERERTKSRKKDC